MWSGPGKITLQSRYNGSYFAVSPQISLNFVCAYAHLKIVSGHSVSESITSRVQPILTLDILTIDQLMSIYQYVLHILTINRDIAPYSSYQAIFIITCKYLYRYPQIFIQVVITKLRYLYLRV
eukprot:g67958.t1